MAKNDLDDEQGTTTLFGKKFIKTCEDFDDRKK
jgi:hypothetical protein